MLASLAIAYPGTTPDYWLDKQPLENWFMYLGYAEEQMQHQAQVLVGTLSMAFAGKKLPRQKPLIVSSEDEAPDRAAFYANPEIRKRIVKGPK